MLKTFIKRPILSLVVSLVIVLLGVVGLTRLPMSLYPEIASPCVYVSGVYPGASAENMARSVAPIIEQAINGVENMTYMTTTIGNDGSLYMNIFFKVGTDPDIASVNVQNRISTVTAELPQEMVRIGIQTSKIENSNIMYLGMESASGELDEEFLQNYANINFIPQLKRIPGVGKIEQFGTKDFAMRVWLDPAKMALYRVSVEEVIAALSEQNIEIAAGAIGQESSNRFQYSITYRGKYNTAEEYGEIVVRTAQHGSLLLLKDIAEINLGSYSYLTQTDVNRNPGVMIGISQTAGSNANEIITNVEKLIEEVGSTLPPGVKFVTFMSSKTSLDSSISEVVKTLLLAFFLVFVVVYVFLQDIRSTILIGLCIPISVVGSFFVMSLAGLSLNLLTLFALVLSIGIVVDNATVVVELISRKMQNDRMYPRAAAHSALHEITSAVVSSTLVMVAVFAPVTFIEGAVGRFYLQFAISMMASLIISGIYSLTLCPALAALFMKRDKNAGGGWFGRLEKNYEEAFNKVFGRFTEYYGRVQARLIKRWKLFTLAFVSVLVLAGVLMFRTPTGFVPNEDDNFLMAAVSLPAATSLEYTSQVMQEISGLLMEHPAVDLVGSVPGFDALNNSQVSSAGIMMIKLREHNDRGDIRNIMWIQYMLMEELYVAFPEATIYVMKPPSLPGFGNFGGVEFILQDREDRPIGEFNDMAESFSEKLNELPQVSMAMVSFDARTPQYELEIDHKKAKQLGVDVSHLANTLQVFYGSMIASDFSRFGRNYKVILQAAPRSRKTPESLNNIYVTNAAGTQIPVSAVAKLTESQGPVSISRFNMYNSIMVNVEPNSGISTGQLIEAIETTAASQLPSGYSYEWQGVAREQKESTSSTVVIFGLSLILVFLILMAQYDSFMMPFAILLAVPSALVGVFAGVNIGGLLEGLDNNIFVQVAILMLIGLSGKNSILIVENALQLRKAGYTIVMSAILAAKSRLRPILMTSLTTVLGALPMIFAVGPSAIGNHSISAATIGGMLSGIIGGLIFTPPLFVAFRALEEKLFRKQLHLK